MAGELFRRAFPTASVATHAWIRSTVVGGVNTVRNIPAWYPVENNFTANEDDQGRGVFDPVPFDPASPAHGPRFPPESYQFLSTPIRARRAADGTRGTDPRSEQLRREIAQMRVDFEEGRLWPLLLTSRETIRDLPHDEYLRQAARVRESRRS